MVKVCGITRREDALAAAEAGASAIGFIFYPKSPRYVTPEKAREVGDGIEAWKVGVFVDESPAFIEEVVRTAKLDVAQIYGVSFRRAFAHGAPFAWSLDTAPFVTRARRRSSSMARRTASGSIGST